MKKLLSFSIVAFLAVCAHASDPRIAAAAKEMTHIPIPLKTHGEFERGIFRDIPSSATVRQILDYVFERFTYEPNKIKQYKILATENVRLKGHPNPVTAVLIESALGKRVIFMSYEEDHWWMQGVETK